MRTFRALTITLALAMGISATALAASALAALPELYKGGAPNTKTVPFTSTSGPGRLETVGGHTVECEADTNSGEVVGSKEVRKVVVSFTGCKASVFTTPACETSGAAEGEITTDSLKGELGYLEGEEAGVKKVGLDLTPESGTGFAAFECHTLFGTEHITVTGGSLICQMKPVNKEQTTATLVCNQEKGVQEFTHLEGGSEDTLTTTGEGPESFGPEQSGENSGEDTITLAEALEIRA
ncbi:MAG: hypothetical protein ACYCUM_05430 [Solirubrobacteraceae bacterium]